jgi:trans-2,3-dihydro-3-hydroxyanthranilate isomerase
MNYEFELVDVFTERPFSGNQLAVLPDARGLTAAQMQAIAREFNFAESAFVLPPVTSGSTARLRIFAPGEEMPFAGHPTVGSAAVLARRGASGASGSSADILFDEAIGKVKVTVDWRGGHACAELCLEPTLERPDGVPSTERLAAALTLPSGDVVDAWFAGVGLPFAYCRLVSARAVDEAVLDRAAFAAALGGTWARNLFLFAGEPVDGATLHGRMFAPGIGVEEDPATGSACAALAGWIASGDPRPDVTLSITVQQGVAMGRPSLLRGGATKVGGNLRSITVGGNVLFVGGGHLDVPAAS